MNFFKKNHKILILSVLAIIFFFIYSYLSLAAPLVFNSPDETANYYFANLFASEGRLWSPEPLEFLTDDSIFPRSIKAVNGNLVPVSFIGLPLAYGIIGKIFGAWCLIFLTPFFTALVVLAFFGITRKIFKESVAFWSCVFLFFLPPLWYYATRGFFHNVFFVDALIIAIYLIQESFANRDIYAPIRQLKNTYLVKILAVLFYFVKIFRYVFAGLFLGFALSARLSELPWVAFIIVALLVFKLPDERFRKTDTWRRGLLIMMSTFVLVAIVIISQNKILYGSFLATGYQNQTVASAGVLPAVADEIKIITDYKLPFTLNPEIIGWSVWNYFIDFFPWFVIPSLAGVLLFLLKKEKTLNEKIYLAVFFITSAWLLAFYGSWKIADNPDPTKITIGTSYLRYWLPVFIMLTPFFAGFLSYIANVFKSKIWKFSIIFFVTVVFCYLSFASVFYAEGEGIFAVKDTLFRYEARGQEVFAITEPNSIIVTDRNDKLFFPERRIIYPLRDDKTYGLVLKLIKYVPVYYYGIVLSDSDLNYLQNEKIKGLKIEELQRRGNEGLYKFLIANN